MCWVFFCTCAVTSLTTTTLQAIWVIWVFLVLKLYMTKVKRQCSQNRIKGQENLKNCSKRETQTQFESNSEREKVPILGSFLSLLPLSRLFVSQLLSKQAVTLIPPLAVKYERRSTDTHVEMHSCVSGFMPSGLPWRWAQGKPSFPTDHIVLFMEARGQMSTSWVFIYSVWVHVCAWHRVWIILTLMK